MGISLGLATTVSPASGSTYVPNCLLSDLFVISLPASGTLTIGPATNVGQGQTIVVRTIIPNGTSTLTWDPAYQLSSGGGGTFQGASFIVTFEFLHFNGIFLKKFEQQSAV